MDKQFFLNAGMLPHFQFNQSAIPTWRSFSPMETQSSDLHFPAPALTSPISVSNSELSNKRFVIKELIGKLDNVCNSGEISPPEKTPVTSHTFPVPPFGSSLPAIPVDPGFADRATRLSYFGSRSFSGKTGEFVCPTSSDSTQLIVGEKLHKVCSSPTIDGSSTAENKNPENSLGLEHTNPVGEIGSRPGNDGNSFSRKRKSLAKGKCNEIPTSPSTKVIENGEISNAKRSKFTEDSNNENKKQTGNNTDQKSAEPPKDYIHVRARRGQATDSHSLAERVRREKISERMKLLQDIVPGCNKVTGKALMLEEIINYVQSLQRQVEFLSMKLSTVSPRVDFNTNNLFHKDVYQPNCSLQTHPKYPLDTFTTCNYDANPLEQISITRSGMGPPCSNPTNPLNQTNGILLPTIDGLNNGVSKLCEGDLHTIVQMGFGQNTKSNQDNTFQNQFLQDQIRYLQ